MNSIPLKLNKAYRDFFKKGYREIKSKDELSWGIDYFNRYF
jgi:hypothetical protein